MFVTIATKQVTWRESVKKQELQDLRKTDQWSVTIAKDLDTCQEIAQMKELKDKSDLRDLKEETEKEVRDLTKVKEVRDLTKVLDATNVRNSVILPETVLKLKETEEDLRDLKEARDLKEVIDLKEGIEVTEGTESVTSVSRVDILLEIVK